MAGEPTTAPAGEQPSAEDAQKLWNEVQAERESAGSDAAAGDEARAEADTEGTDSKPTDEAGDATDATDAKADGASAKTEEDPFAGLPPAVVERLKRLDALQEQVAAIPDLQRQLNEARGRVSAVQSELAQAKAAAKTVDTAPSAKQIAAASETPEKWKALKEDFPEWAEATEAFVQAKLAGLTPTQAAGMSPEDVEKAIEQRVSAALRQAEEDRITDRHGDWKSTVKTPEFGAWFAAQDDDVKQLAKSTRASDAIRMLDLFQTARQQPADQTQAKRTNRLASAVTTVGQGAKPAAKTPDQMTPAELWEYERSQAKRRGSSHGLVY